MHAAAATIAALAVIAGRRLHHKVKQAAEMKMFTSSHQVRFLHHFHTCASAAPLLATTTPNDGAINLFLKDKRLPCFPMLVLLLMLMPPPAASVPMLLFANLASHWYHFAALLHHIYTVNECGVSSRLGSAVYQK